ADMWFNPLAPVAPPPVVTERPAVSYETNNEGPAAQPAQAVTLTPALANAEPTRQEVAVVQQELFVIPSPPEAVTPPPPVNVPPFGAGNQPQVTPRGRQL
ncbi:hypothetical protein, partial [Granulicella aggregans]|uniref:hypothetical protein n=1 Tax=Granulicella aggregans TaxID=474949 RepID=UPI001C85B623